MELLSYSSVDDSVNINDDQDASCQDDVILREAKQDSQRRSIAVMERGERSQISMFLIAPDLARSAKIRWRSDEF